MFEKKAYMVQMTLDVPSSERRSAEQAEEAFDSLMSSIKLAKEHLELIYIPLQKHQSIPTEELIENRGLLRNFKKKVKRNFEHIIKKAYECLSLMGEFSTDSTVEELMNSFVSSTRELEKQVNYLLSIFSNLNDPEFRNQLIAAIDSVKKQTSQLRQLVNDRVLEHIDTNILAKNWEGLVNDRFQKEDEEIDKQKPLLVQLYKERKKALSS